MSEQVVAVAPDGSARSTDVQMLPVFAVSVSPNSAFIARNGAGQNALNGASTNWGLSGESPTMILYKSASCYRIRAGAIFSDYRIPLICAKPPQITSWTDGLFTIECAMAWPTNSAGVENGLVIGFHNNVANLRPVSTANQGFAIYNEGGVLTFAMRGAVGLQTTALAGTITEWNKVKVLLTHATKDADAVVSVFVNDGPVAAVSKTSADANFPAIGATVNSVLAWGFGTASATEYCNFRSVRFARGPNSIVGA